jgi:ribosome-binding ATPase YchF (GTP1/OBG family)
VKYEDLKENGTWNKAKEKGLVRMEGKQYIVQD